MHASTHILAHAAGALHEKYVRIYLNDFREASEDTGRYIHLTFRRLQNIHMLCKSEILQLERILTLLNNHQASVAEAQKLVRDVLNTLVEQDASPCAVALASIAENSLQLCSEMESPTAKEKLKWWQILGADLEGAGAGALAGSMLPGVGTTTGAICGAAIASGKAIQST